ncbi:sigma-E factor negative regulatory protein [Uliginosibacterium sp. H3]|uniref:Sigma-E factor negative regulatory protein n=1 Tax=Uliginosibacterium silvisoli TaxID=3114758 RepID=A0ABU6K9F3_9RHOO|nr:sigma-E factor negative regulatory protein [Uliginosibacterium sp. H3]
MMNEQISAWVDGELSEVEMHRVQDAVVRDPALQMKCGTLWLIGDAMRDEPALSLDFTRRVMAELAAEPTVLAPVIVLPVKSVGRAQRWMPMAAAVAGVAVVAWVALSNSASQQVAAPVMAVAKPQAQQFALQAGVQRSVSRADDDRPYLMAHQAYGPGVQMAGVSGYVRPVSMDGAIASR